MSYSTYIEIAGIEYYTEVVYSYFPPCKGSRNEYGVPMEPDETANVEISSVRIKDGDTWIPMDFPESVLEKLEDEILEDRCE